MRKIGAPGLLLISPLWRNPGRLVENTPHLQDNRHFLFYPVSFPANKLHNKILFAKSALFGTVMVIRRAIPDTLPLFVPEAADETVEFQINAIADALEILKEQD